MVVEAETEIIRRIFQRYVDGSTPQDIAHALNRDGVPLAAVLGTHRR